MAPVLHENAVVTLGSMEPEPVGYYTGGVDVGTVAQQFGQSPEVALRYYRQRTPAQRRRAVALAGLLAPSNVRALDAARKTQDG